MKVGDLVRPKRAFGHLFLPSKAVGLILRTWPTQGVKVHWISGCVDIYNKNMLEKVSESR